MAAAQEWPGCGWKTLTRSGETRAAVSVAALPEVSWLGPRGQRSELWRDARGKVCRERLNYKKEEGSEQAGSPHLGLARPEGEVCLRALEGGPFSSSVAPAWCS